MPQFLTPEWWEAAHEIRARYADQAGEVPYKIKMNQVITGAPFAEGEVQFHMDTTEGRMSMEPGHLDDPEVTVTTDYDTARAILVEQDAQAAMQAFMSGRIKIQGDMTKLMMMQGAPVDEIAKKVAEEIRAITE